MAQVDSGAYHKSLNVNLMPKTQLMVEGQNQLHKAVLRSSSTCDMCAPLPTLSLSQNTYTHFFKNEILTEVSPKSIHQNGVA